MDNTLFGIPLVVLGFICTGVAVAYAFVWPRPNPSDPPRPPLRAFSLRWGHALVWLMLALACFVAGPGTGLLAGALGIGAIVLYVLFIASIFLDRQAAATAALERRRSADDPADPPSPS